MHIKYPVRNVSIEHLNWLNTIFSTDLPAYSKLIASYLSTYMNSRQQCAWPSRKRIAQECSITKNSVQKFVTVLEEEGWVKKKRGGFKDGENITNRYTIAFPQEVLDQIHGGGGSPHDLRGVTTCSTGGSPHDPESIKTINKYKREGGQAATPHVPVAVSKDKTPRKQLRINPLELLIPDAVDPSTWQEWVEYKAGTKSPITTKAVATKALNVLARHSVDGQKSMVEYSMQSGYPGLYEDKANKPKVNGASHGKSSADNRSDIANELINPAGNYDDPEYVQRLMRDAAKDRG